MARLLRRQARSSFLRPCGPHERVLQTSHACPAVGRVGRAGSSLGALHRGGVAPPERSVQHASQGRLFQPRCRPEGVPLRGGLEQPRPPWFRRGGVPPRGGGSVSLPCPGSCGRHPPDIRRPYGKPCGRLFFYGACGPPGRMVQTSSLVPRVGADSGGPGLAWCSAPGRRCAARAFRPTPITGKAVSAPLSPRGGITPWRPGTTPPAVVPPGSNSSPGRRVREPSVSRVVW
jgi:hypothetical protein